MKVLHLSSERSWRGGEQQIAYLIDELEQKGVENIVACKKKSAFESYCKNNQIPFINPPFANEFDLFSAWEIRNFCKEFKINIVHMHSGHAHAIGVWSSLLGNPARLILSRRVDFPIKNNWFSKYKYNYAKIEKIICVSEAIQKITQLGLNKPDKCVVVHSGIDLKKFKNTEKKFILHHEFGLSKEIPTIANISAIAPHKDYFTFVNTVEVLIKKEFKANFLIIGDGSERKKIEQYVIGKGLENHIIFTGFRNDIPKILKDIDLLLITSKTEGLGTTILDAFANEIPVVATNAGGIPEVVIHEQTGLLASVGDFNLLAEHVRTLLTNPKLKDNLVYNAKNHLISHFTTTSTALKTWTIYHRISF